MDPVGANTRELVEAGRLIDQVIAPAAERVDADGVQRSTLDALAAAGLLGTALPPPDQRELAELIAAADASTWFCWVQHQTPLRSLEDARPSTETPAVEALRDELLPGLREGRLLAGVAFAHLRRPGPPNPTARRVPGGWLLNGTLDWVTSWDIADVLLIMAQATGDDADRIIYCYLPAGRSGVTIGLKAGEPLRLLAMSGTHTRPIALHEVFVPTGRIAAVLDRGTWIAADAARAVDANPAAFGIARGAIAELHAIAEQCSDAGMQQLVDALVDECRGVRAEAYDLADDDDAAARVDRRLALRASSLDLCTRATTAVVVARAGAAMLSGHSAERRLREAMFLLVQAQTRPSRDASLALMQGLAEQAAQRATYGP